ncbi:DUF58 domain-containing protein [Rubricoccus marinus]|uniref:DUF58 domain-containing protein n=1 Tax=Rubricoccus marinus TaxID=716817 RepID=A0A259TY96_9BACT|nr:DUF58 domain-containing protein [Rubricoccus marinus]OZC02666.1 hypothetical protein BSZ36_06565 [Rubricoccus marinus]
MGPFRDLFLPARFFQVGTALVVVFVVAFFWPPLLWAAKAMAFALAVLLLADALLLWGTRKGGLVATRAVEDKLSMGDENEVALNVENRYGTPISARIIDEAPVQFQKRDTGDLLPLAARGAEGARQRRTYSLRPTERGVYGFGHLNLFAATPIGLINRRFRAVPPQEVKVYPSIIQMRKYAFLAESNRLEEAGLKRVRRLGQTMEFDQVRTYVPGDDRRTINWKATARRGMASGGGPSLLVNQYEEERAQPVVAALDMGRAMRSPFEGITLLDHAVNTSLVLLNTALIKADKAGLVTFDHEVRTVVAPDRGRGQLSRVLESLYRQRPSYRDPSYEAFYAAVRSRLKRRSLILLFTNFDTRAGLERQLPYLARIARKHRLVVVLFENSGIRELLETPAERLEDVYVKTTAETLAMEKREIARTLERRGIGSILTSPEHLTVDAVNRYIALKARGSF